MDGVGICMQITQITTWFGRGGQIFFVLSLRIGNRSCKQQLLQISTYHYFEPEREAKDTKIYLNSKLKIQVQQHDKKERKKQKTKQHPEHNIEKTKDWAIQTQPGLIWYVIFGKGRTGLWLR